MPSDRCLASESITQYLSCSHARMLSCDRVVNVMLVTLSTAYRVIGRCRLNLPLSISRALMLARFHAIMLSYLLVTI